jgi:hypothetical protein
LSPPSSTFMTGGGTAQVTVTLTAGNTSGIVQFQAQSPTVAGTAGHAGNAGANGLL